MGNSYQKFNLSYEDDLDRFKHFIFGTQYVNNIKQKLDTIMERTTLTWYTLSNKLESNTYVKKNLSNEWVNVKNIVINAIKPNNSVLKIESLDITNSLFDTAFFRIFSEFFPVTVSEIYVNIDNKNYKLTFEDMTIIVENI